MPSTGLESLYSFRQALTMEPPVTNSPASRTPNLARFGAFSHLPFTVIWFATTCSCTGIAISDAASAWLMTNLNTDPALVSMVQVASSLPMFLFTFLAGVLADMVDPRRFLIALELFITISILLFGGVIFMQWVTPNILLIATFTLSACWSLATPVWLSITPLLVPPEDLDSANSANSVGYNLSRAIGPALAGFALSAFGPAAPYWIFGMADSTTVMALFWWKSPKRPKRPTESFFTAIQTGVVYAAKNKKLRATFVRTIAVYPFACTYSALLPLVARNQVTQGPKFYGVMLAVISIGAVIGSLILHQMRKWLGADSVVAAGTVGIAVALCLFGLAHSPAVALIGALVAGGSWTIVLVGLYVSTFLCLDEWIRGRGVSIFLTVLFGSMTCGSMLWGQVAAKYGLPSAFFISAGCLVLMIPLTWRWKLQAAQGVNP